MNLVFKIIRFFKYLNDKYDINNLASSISFYMLVSILSVLILLIQISSFLPFETQKLIFFEILKIVEEDTELVIQDVNKYLTGLSNLVVLGSLIWSSSRIINGYIKATNRLKFEDNKIIKNRIKSLWITIILFIIAIIEFGLIVVGDYLISNYLNEYLIFVAFFKHIIEYLIVFTSIYLLNKFCFKMNNKDIIRGVLISSIIIYILMYGFIWILRLVRKENYIITTQLFIPILSLFVFLVNYIIIIGFTYNIWELKNGLNEEKFIV